MKSTTHFKNNKKGIECLNCGAPFRGNENFCPECGQVNDERRLSIKDYFQGFFSNFFSFDSRLYKTIVPLLFKPGLVSKEYIEGKRKKYANPFQLLLHTVVVYFLALGLFNSIENYQTIDKQSRDFIFDKDSVKTKKIGTFTISESKKFDFENLYHQKLDSIFKEKDYVTFFNNDSIPTTEKDSLIALWHEKGVQILNKNYNRKGTKVKSNEILTISDDIIRTSNELQSYLDEKTIHYKLKDSYFESIGDAFGKQVFLKGIGSKFSKFRSFSRQNANLSEFEALDSLKAKTNKLNIFLYQKAKESNDIFKNEKTVKAFWNDILSKITIALFFLLPIFTLFFSLVYIRHPHRYSEHLVVVFNIQTAFFIVLLISLIIENLFNIEFIGIILQISFVLYVYLTLKKVYQQGWFKSLLKLIFLTITYNLLVIIGFVLISFIAFLL